MIYRNLSFLNYKIRSGSVSVREVLLDGTYCKFYPCSTDFGSTRPSQVRCVLSGDDKRYRYLYYFEADAMHWSVAEQMVETSVLRST